MRGEAFKKTFTLIKDGLPDQSTVDYVATRAAICCFKIPVLAMDDALDTDPLKNDFTSVYFGYSDIVTDVELKLYKNDVLFGTLNSNTYGTFYDYGFHTDGKKTYTGYLINWQSILNGVGLGEGNYYVKAVATKLTGGTYEEDSFSYCLYAYTANRANGTIRIEFYNNGILGDRNIDTDKVSYKNLNWYNSIRLKGIVLKESTTYENEMFQYTNGQRDDIKDEQEPVYDVLIKPIPYFLHKFLRNDVLQSTDLYISDYNANCKLKPFLMQNLKRYGNYEPTYTPLTMNDDVTIQFIKKYNNLRKQHS